MTNDKTLRVLICEDETILRTWLVRSVQQMGHEVVGQARDGEVAQELALSTDPDFILMDIKMPRCDGLTATAEILRHRPVPILILTAYGDGDAVARALEIGVAGYLVKPIDAGQLAPAIALAYAKFNEVHGLRDQVASLQEILEQRKLIERAKGILMRSLRVDEESAHRLMQRLSSLERRALKDVAQGIIDADKTGTLSAWAKGTN
jgi:AmiR/NasT family two-component response regulator